jgi:hypothetical protein
MLERSVQYRAVIYAALYAPALRLTRDQATGFYSRLAERLFPKLSLQYMPAEEERSFRIVMEEKGEGGRRDTLTADIHQGLFRLMLHQEWPDSFDIASRKADEVIGIFRESVATLGDCEAHLVEVRVRAQVPVQQKSAKDYLVSRLMRDQSRDLDVLGPVAFFGFRYDVGPQGVFSSPLDSPAREVLVEPLRQEQGFLYLEVMSNWGRSAIQPLPDKPDQAELVPGPLSAADQLPKPSQYLGEVGNYLEQVLCPFLEKAQ